MSGDQILYSPDDPAEIDAEYATCWSADEIAMIIDISQYSLRAWTERQFVRDMVEQRCMEKDSWTVSVHPWQICRQS